MKSRWFRWMLLLLTLGATTPAYAQVVKKTLSGTTCPGDGCITIDTAGAGTVGVQVTGTFVGTLTFTQSVGKSTFVSWNVTPNGSSTVVTTATAAGVWFGPTAGVSQVRVAFTAFTSGTAVVSSVTTQARKIGTTDLPNPMNLSGPVFLNRNATLPTKITSDDQDGLVVWGIDATQATVSTYTFGAAAPVFMGARAGGTGANPSASQTDDTLLRLQGAGYFTGATSGWATKAEMQVHAAQNWSDTVQGAYINWLTTASGGTTRSEKMRLFGSGGLNVAATPTTDPGVGVISAGVGYQINAAATTGTVLRGNGTNYVATTATYPNTVATGNILVASATNVVSAVTPGSVNANPANQTGNATSTLKMNGLGAAAAPCVVTLAMSGRVGFTISGRIVQTTTADGVSFKMVYGTGTPPANAAVASGTALTPTTNHTALTGALEEPFSVTGVATGLSLVATWFDLQVANVTGGTASVADVTCAAWEF